MRERKTIGILALTALCFFATERTAYCQIQSIPDGAPLAPRNNPVFTGNATFGTTIIDPVNGVTQVPSNSAIVIAGDSICFGPSATTRWSYYLKTMSQFNGRVTENNTCVSGRKIADITSAYAAEVFPFRPSVTGNAKVYLFVAVGTNDLDAVGDDPAAIYTSVASYWSTAKADGFTVVAFTVMNRILTQGVLSPVSPNVWSIAQTFNSSVRRAPAGSYDFLVDEAQLFDNPSDTNYFSDGTHPVAAAHLKIAQYINFVFGGKAITLVPQPHPPNPGISSLGCQFENLVANTGTDNTGCGFNALVNNTTANFNTAVGSLSLASESTGSQNTAVGYQALELATTSNNTAVGSASLAVMTSGAQNTAVGMQALAALTTVSDNTAVGFQALTTDSSGTNNTAVGSGALKLNLTGSGETAVGYHALTAATAAQNTGVGYNALSSTTSGTNNVGVGYASGVTATGGNANVSGTQNTWIGMQSGPSSSTQLSNSSAIGYQALSPASNSVQLGNSSVTEMCFGNSICWLYGAGVPSSGLCVSGNIGSLYSNTSGGASTTLYVCTAAATWTAK